MSQIEKKMQIEHQYIGTIFGQFDSNIKKIEQACCVQIVNRGDDIKIIGEEKGVTNAENVLHSLEVLVKKGEEITEQNVMYLLQTVEQNYLTEVEKMYDDFICMTVNGRPVKPKTLGQKKVNRIILTRPAIEAGEKLGFLPGDLQQKVDPYLRPLYDALHEIMGADTFMKNMEKGLIEVAPLAYMRGRTLDNAFIVLDEAQNTTPEQMKMFLTRIGYGSKAVITGDLTQIDLAEGKRSGLLEATKILSGIEDIGIITLTNKDVVRHPLVQKIIQAYEKFENRKRK